MPSETKSYTVCHTCPHCSSELYDRIRPNKSIYYTLDRVCQKCKTRYTPPTPLWATMLFLICGIVFILATALPLLFSAIAVNPIGIGINGLFMAMGILATCEGFAGLRQDIASPGTLHAPLVEPIAPGSLIPVKPPRTPKEIASIKWRMSAACASLVFSIAIFVVVIMEAKVSEDMEKAAIIVFLTNSALSIILIFGLGRRLFGISMGIAMSLLGLFPLVNSITLMVLIVSAIVILNDETKKQAKLSANEPFDLSTLPVID